MPACRILSLARTSRLPIAAGEVRNAEAIVFASSPSTTCSISGARMPASMAGCAQANISARRWSGISASAAAASSPSREELQLRRGAPRRCGAAARHRSAFAGRRSAARLPDSTDSHCSGQSASAEANASDSASSAAATSRVRAARKATSLP